MKDPTTERYVLTWVRDRGGLEYWQIDSFCKKAGWLTARAWEQRVLHWQELPPRPALDREKRE